MKIIKKILILIWRIWFYAWMLGTIFVALPILIVVISKEEWYPVFFKIARAWANTVLFVMGFSTKVEREEELLASQSYVFCPNHTSILDILLTLSITKNPFVFLGKKELVNIPVFGYVYKRTCILVDRNDIKSRRTAFRQAQKRLQKGLSVCIFPEGNVPDDESIVLDTFQKGAFRLAVDFKIPIVPITYYDCKKRFSYTFFSGSPGILRVKTLRFLLTNNLEQKDLNSLKEKTYQIIYNDLIQDQN
jgi:1-acyl-sn-glycerol-3-phosphate acyltransferase